MIEILIFDGNLHAFVGPGGLLLQVPIVYVCLAMELGWGQDGWILWLMVDITYSWGLHVHICLYIYINIIVFRNQLINGGHHPEEILEIKHVWLTVFLLNVDIIWHNIRSVLKHGIVLSLFFLTGSNSFTHPQRDSKQVGLGCSSGGVLNWGIPSHHEFQYWNGHPWLGWFWVRSCHRKPPSSYFGVVWFDPSPFENDKASLDPHITWQLIRRPRY